jgi:Sulfotransferase domain
LLLPDFLVIGAMKAGTTSMYLDLSQHTSVFFPTLKEPGNLARADVLTEPGRASYASLYRRAKDGQRRGDASTDYAKLPDVTGVPGRAFTVLGAQTRIVYLVREPVSRAVSHHHHLVARGQAPPNFEAALEAVPGIVEYSCYGRQVEPWIDLFGPGALLVVRLEDYAADRQATFDAVLGHLSLASSTVDRDDVGNKSSVDPPAQGRSAVVRDNRAYRRLLRPLLPEGARRRLRRALLPTPPPRPDPPRLATVKALVARFEADQERLRRLIAAPGPLWDLGEVEARAAAPGQARR